MGLWSNSYVRDKRIQIVFFSALGFALVVGLYEGVVIKHTGYRSTSLQVAYLFEAMWEAAFFGFGIGFFFVYGYAMRKVEKGIIRRRCIGIWLAISYYFVSFWPHSAGHQFFFSQNDPTHKIILEVCFHWPNLASALVLCYYQFDMLLISYNIAKNNRELRFWSERDLLPTPWYKNKFFHSAIISILASAGWIAFSFHFNPYPPTAMQWQKGMIITIYVADGCASGVALGFAYCGGRIAHRIPKKRTRFIAALSITAIVFLITVTTPHPAAHYAVRKSATSYVIIEYAFHLPITAAISVLAFYQHRFLVLAIDGRMSLMMKFKSAKPEEVSSTTSDVELKHLSINTGTDPGTISTGTTATTFSSGSED